MRLHSNCCASRYLMAGWYAPLLHGAGSGHRMHGGRTCGGGHSQRLGSGGVHRYSSG
jgi:hypothetical protein